MTVLIVDDEEEIRESLREVLEDEGYRVATAADGADALRCLEDQLPCVVILDLMLPVLDGNAVYERMQRHEALSRVPVIVSTSDPSRAPSGVLIMKKPINLDRLLGAVRQHCQES
jgi:DNA-binding response OmpR family regulator